MWRDIDYLDVYVVDDGATHRLRPIGEARPWGQDCPSGDPGPRERECRGAPVGREGVDDQPLGEDRNAWPHWETCVFLGILLAVWVAYWAAMVWLLKELA